VSSWPPRFAQPAPSSGRMRLARAARDEEGARRLWKVSEAAEERHCPLHLELAGSLRGCCQTCEAPRIQNAPAGCRGSRGGWSPGSSIWARCARISSSGSSVRSRSPSHSSPPTRLLGRRCGTNLEGNRHASLQDPPVCGTHTKSSRSPSGLLFVTRAGALPGRSIQTQSPDRPVKAATRASAPAKESRPRQLRRSARR
jgi:hypothetical protein